MGILRFCLGSMDRLHQRDFYKGPSARPCRGHASAVSLVASFAAVVLFGAVSTAAATVITSWYGIQPTGNVGTNVPITVQGSGPYDGYPLVPSSAKMFVDGVQIPPGTFTSNISNSTVYFYYSVNPVLTDGVHLFRVEVSDTLGRLSFYQWTARVVQPPTASWVQPPPGSTLYTGYPGIVMSLSDNTPGTTFAVVGSVRTGSSAGPVVRTFGGTGLPAGQSSFGVTPELAPGTYYLTASVSDAAGNVRTLTGSSARAFSLVAAPAMTRLTSCEGGDTDTCHATYRATHPATVDCVVCHVGYDTNHQGDPYCDDCHLPGEWHESSVSISGACTDCHTPARTDVPQHTAASVAPSHASSCEGCHATSLLGQHAVTPAGSSYPYQCDVCHASADAEVEGAITAQDTSCAACHGADLHLVAHGSAYFDSRPQCLECHSSNLVTEHVTDRGMTCLVCHGPGLTPTSKDCSACHVAIHNVFTGEAVNPRYPRYIAWSFAEWLASQNPDGALMARGPHGGYATTTIKCAVCHSVHRGGSKLLNEGSTCAFCHTAAYYGGGAFASNLISWGGAGPHASRCTNYDCHGGPHGVGASTYDGPASRLLTDALDTELGALAAANNVPTSEFATWTPTTRALATGALCGRDGCHDDSMFGVVSAGATQTVDTGGAITAAVTGHRVIASATSNWNANGTDFPTSTTGLTIAFSSVSYCSSCHDLSDDNNGGKPAFPHGINGVVDTAAGADGSWRPAVWLTAASSATDTRTAVGAYNSYSATDSPNGVAGAAGSSILDGVCLKCHRSGTSGVGATY